MKLYISHSQLRHHNKTGYGAIKPVWSHSYKNVGGHYIINFVDLRRNRINNDNKKGGCVPRKIYESNGEQQSEMYTLLYTRWGMIYCISHLLEHRGLLSCRLMSSPEWELRLGFSLTVPRAVQLNFDWKLLYFASHLVKWSPVSLLYERHHSDTDWALYLLQMTHTHTHTQGQQMSDFTAGTSLYCISSREQSECRWFTEAQSWTRTW